MRRRAILLLPVSLLAAADRVAWQKASVLHAQYTPDNLYTASPSAGGSSPQVFRGEFDFDTGENVYTARETVAGNARLSLAPGDSVVIAIGKNTVRLRLPNGKERKLKLAATWPKSKRSLP